MFKKGNKFGKRWQKGVCPNPNPGHPRSNLVKLLAEVGQRKEKGSKKTNEQILIDRLWKIAKLGSIRASEIILERLQGKVKEIVGLELEMSLMTREEMMTIAQRVIASRQQQKLLEAKDVTPGKSNDNDSQLPPGESK